MEGRFRIFRVIEWSIWVIEVHARIAGVKRGSSGVTGDGRRWLGYGRQCDLNRKCGVLGAKVSSKHCS